MDNRAGNVIRNPRKSANAETPLSADRFSALSLPSKHHDGFVDSRVYFGTRPEQEQPRREEFLRASRGKKIHVAARCRRAGGGMAQRRTVHSSMRDARRLKYPGHSCDSSIKHDALAARQSSPPHYTLAAAGGSCGGGARRARAAVSAHSGDD